MNQLKNLILLIIVCAIGLSACGQNAATHATAVPQPIPSGSMAEFGSPYGENARWPNSIPADIPVLDGEIELVMEAPGSRIRIFYSTLPEKQVSQYLTQLKADNFQLEYIVYTQEGFPDTSQERIAKGEFDAVDITKGSYHMRLEVGGGQGTYDIYTTGFTSSEPQEVMIATPIPWPSDIPTQISPPPNCEIDALATLGDGSYQITFTCADEDVQAQFITMMLAAGLAETDRLVSDKGEIVQMTLQDKDVTVKAMGAVYPYFTIQVFSTAP